MIDAIEATTNAVIGYLVSVTATWLILPLWGFPASLGASFGISAVFFVVSFLRSFALRRIFRRIHNKSIR